MAEICFQKAPGQNLPPKALKLPKFASKRFPGQDLAQKGRFPRVPEGDFNCRPKGLQIAEICFQKAPRPGFGPNGPFPKGPRKEF